MSAFVLCLRLALLYSFGFFLIGWLFGSSGSLNEAVAMPAGLGWWPRLWRVLVIAGIAALLGLYWANLERIVEILRRLFGRLSTAFGFAISVALAFALAGAFAQAVVVVVFFVLLPVTNALLDWLSWAVSRSLGRGIERRHGHPKVLPLTVGYAALDLVIAVVLLFFLAATIATVISGYNVFLPTEAKIALVDHIRLAQRYPLGDGLWATAMLFSTLVPTALHFGMAVVGVFCSIVSSRWRKTTIATLGECKPSRASLLRAYLYEFCGVLVVITALGVVCWSVPALYDTALGSTVGVDLIGKVALWVAEAFAS